MLYTDLKINQHIKIGEAEIKLIGIRDCDSQPKIRLQIQAPKSVKIEFDDNKRKSG